ncbi:MAG: glycosyltransferase [Desulfotignum sp.]|jgi:glycosyltransferase involved in cell wall biosynthesis|nr:glycosyltransferase [Desulfotignum sp.]
MKLSVIVTTYKRMDALKKVLEGLYAQTRLPDEILVADDWSGGDISGDISNVLAQFENKSCPTFFHVWQKNLGFRATLVRNRIVLADRGDCLVLLDGDCIPDCHFVADNLCFKSCKLSVIRSCNMGFYRQDALSVKGFNRDFEGWGRQKSEFAARLFKMDLKKKHPFMAICYHMWHKESLRIFLESNDGLLTKALASEAYACEHGLNSVNPCNKSSRVNSYREAGHGSA